MGLIELLVVLLLVVVIAGVALYALSRVPMPAGFRAAADVLVCLIVIVVLFWLLLGVVHGGVRL